MLRTVSIIFLGLSFVSVIVILIDIAQAQTDDGDHGLGLTGDRYLVRTNRTWAYFSFGHMKKSAGQGSRANFVASDNAYTAGTFFQSPSPLHRCEISPDYLE